MKSKVLFVLLSFIALMPFSSCKKEEPTIISVDFGEGKYKEPFRGLLSSHPQWLVATLDWPILRSLRPDTLVLTKTIEIEFNEDAVRSHSEAIVQFVDDSCNRLEGVKVYCNDIPVGKEGFRIEATTEPQLVKIAYKIDPLKKKCTETGLFTVSGVELDEVNSVKLYSDTPKSVADWTYTQKIGWPLLLWLLWLIIALIILALFAGMIYLLIMLFRHVFTNSGTSTELFRDYGTVLQSIDKTAIDIIKQSEKQLYNTKIPCSNRLEELLKIKTYLEQIKKDNTKLYDKLYNSLNPNTREALDRLNKSIKCPAEGPRGHWEDNRFVLSKDNPDYLACKEAGMTDCEYGPDGEPDFSRATEEGTVVPCNDLYDKFDSKHLDKRGGGNSFGCSFQDRAQERIALNKKDEILRFYKERHPNEEFDLYKAYYEWRDSKNLVPHEDANGRTLRLVNRTVHSVFTHTGGISRIRIIKDIFG